MAVELMSLCSIPKVTDRDGGAGPLAQILIPELGYWYPSGQTLAFPRSTVAQNQSITFQAQTRPDTFKKDCCTCV